MKPQSILTIERKPKAHRVFSWDLQNVRNVASLISHRCLSVNDVFVSCVIVERSLSVYISIFGVKYILNRAIQYILHTCLTEEQFNRTTGEVENVKNLAMSNQRAVEVYSPAATVDLRSDLGETFSAEDFQRIMLKTVDEILSLLGKKAKQSIYSQLEETFKITKQDIPLEIERFTAALEEIVGPGSTLLEIEIMKHLYEKIGPEFKYSPKQKNLTFAEYLTATRAFLSMRNSARRPMPNEYYEYKFC